MFVLALRVFLNKEIIFIVAFATIIMNAIAAPTIALGYS